MYAIKNESEDHLFIQRSSLIKKMRPQESMTYLGISQKFILGSHNSKNNKQSSYLMGVINS